MNICKQSKEDVLIAPFVPNVLEVKGNALVESLTAMERHLNGYKNRTMLVQFKGQCSSKSHNPSRMLRTKVSIFGALDGGGTISLEEDWCGKNLNLIRLEKASLGATAEVEVLRLLSIWKLQERCVVQSCSQQRHGVWLKSTM